MMRGPPLGLKQPQTPPTNKSHKIVFSTKKVTISHIPQKKSQTKKIQINTPTPLQKTSGHPDSSKIGGYIEMLAGPMAPGRA
jgi:hypothetical protein